MRPKGKLDAELYAIHKEMLGLLSRDNRLILETRQETINSDFVLEKLDELSFKISKQTVIVFDTAQIHTAHNIKKRLDDIWQNRGLYVFYLPPY